jgi:hypothetical protein
MTNQRPVAACFLLVAAFSHSVAAQQQAEPLGGDDQKTAVVSPVQTTIATPPAEPEVDPSEAPSTTPADESLPTVSEATQAPAVPPTTTEVDDAAPTPVAKRAKPSKPAEMKTTEVDDATPTPVAKRAEPSKPTQPKHKMDLADVIVMMQQQQALLATQGKQLKAQSKQIASLSDELDALRAPSPGLVTEEAKPDIDTANIAKLEEIEQQNASSIQTFKQQKAAQEKTDQEVATSQADDPTRAMQDDFPGAWRLPGTQAALAIGGYVKMAAVVNHDPLTIQDRFIVGSIPVGDEGSDNIESEVSLSAAQSRLNFDLREPTDFGIMRAFIEGDFMGDGEQFRLRHAFGQWNRMLAGKTWSAFMDTEATPESVDFEGLNGRTNVRQTQVRFSPQFGESFSLIASLEDPNPQVQNGDGITRVPDLVLAGRFEPNNRLHMKLSLLGRQIQGEYTDEDNHSTLEKEYAWGLSISGRFKTPYLEQRDSVLFQLSHGNAIGRYVNDLRSVGSYDGIFNDRGDLELFDVTAGYVSYQHWWGSDTRSNITLGIVNVENPGFVEGDAYKRTLRASANWIWTPTPRVDIGLELLWGERENEDSITGNASQTQLMARYRFSQ